MRSAILVTLACSLLSCVGEPPQSSSGGTTPDAGVSLQVFVTKDAHNGDFKGTPDRFCEEQADKKVGRWAAFLAVDTRDAKQAIAGLAGPWTFKNGPELAANADIKALASALAAAHDFDGNTVATADNIWLGEPTDPGRPALTAPGVVRCKEWTSASPPNMGKAVQIGNLTTASNILCDQMTAHVLCFQRPQ
jgi:hypothetical protein